jgi:methyltransferase
MSTTQKLYLLLIAAVALERLVELLITRRNLAWARRRGAREHGRDHYPWMVAVHASFLVACPAEVVALDRPFLPWLGVPMLALLAGAMTLRYWAIATLGRRWTTKILVVPGLPVITGGPYRWLRHPNYLAVAIEVAALPLVHTAWITALVWSVADGLVLRARIRSEEAALRRDSDYDRAMAGRRALMPSSRPEVASEPLPPQPGMGQR